MKPVLFTVGSFNVYAFGVLLAISFILSTFIVWQKAKEDLKEEEYVDLYLYTSIVVLFFARIAYIVFNFRQFGLNFLRYIVVRETPGLSLIGGLVMGFIFLKIYSKKKSYDFLHILDIYSLAGLFALAFAKIGEFLGGAGFGRETTLPVGVIIVGLTGKRHPTELYEAVIFLTTGILCALLYNSIRRKKLPKGLIFFLSAGLLFLFVLGLEFLKEYTVYLYGLSLRQISALLIFLLIFIWFLKIMKVFANLKQLLKKAYESVRRNFKKD